MKKVFKTIKAKIRTVAMAFSLIVAVCLVVVSFYFFQTNFLNNMIWSTEFNLQLVAGVIRQDADSLNLLAKWCCVNSEILSYLKSGGDSGKALLAYKQLSSEYSGNRARTYVRRLVITDTSHKKILQVGIATAQSLPVTQYNVGRLFPSGGSGSWQVVEHDPFDKSSAPASYIIPVRRPIYRENSRQVIGYVYMAVSTKLITDPLSNYSIAPDSALFLTLWKNRYKIKQNRFQLVSGISLTPCRYPGKPLTPAAKICTVLHNGKTAFAVSYPVSSLNMVLSSTLSEQQIFQQHLLFWGMMLLACVGIAALGIFLTKYLNHLINRPIAQLRARMNAISKGDFSPDPAIEWEDEFGEIGRGINHLSQNVVTLMETRLSDEKKKKDLEYQMLQNQINPHFLYNTLNSIKWMATIQNAPGIAEMTTALAELLKNVTKGTRKVITLREEIALADNYFLIQKYRYGGSITLKKRLDPEILDNAIPKFTLQPLLENAIFHGIEPRGGVGTIEIKAGRWGTEGVELSVTDNGIGMDQKTIQDIFVSGKASPEGMFRQIGVLNVHQRIQYEFGADYGITVTSKLGFYTKISVRLPRRSLSFDSLKKEANS